MNSPDSRLVLREIPVALWFFGLIFAGVGVLMIYAGGPYPIMSLLFIGIGLCIVLFASILTVTADRVVRILKFESRSILRHKITEVPFDEIIGVNIERSISSGRGSRTVYRITLLKRDGQVVPLRAHSSGGLKRKEAWVIRLREYLGIQDTNRTPSGMIPMELTQSADIRETDGVRWRLQPLMTYNATAPTGVRWLSTDFRASGVFLFIAQKGEGQSSKGFLASLGKMFIRQAFSAHGFQLEDAPGLDDAVTLEPLDPAIESHFMAYTNSPERARPLLNSMAVAQLAKWAERHPLKQFQSGSRHCQLVTLFGPNGVSVATNHLLEPRQTYELISLGSELVKSQKTGFGLTSYSS